MKIPMKWLREYVDVNMAPQEYASRMIMTGTAVEGVDKTGEQFDGVVVGRVLTCEDHPNSDHLHVCTVDVGGEQLLISRPRKKEFLQALTDYLGGGGI